MGVSEPLIQTVLLGDAVEHAPVAILVSDDEMRYVAANEYACELLGYDRPVLVGLHVTDLACDEDDSKELAAVQAHGKRDGTIRVRRQDGEKLTLRHRSAETTLAGLTYYVAVLWPED
jgi:PAS domain S-box-containing protein